MEKQRKTINRKTIYAAAFLQFITCVTFFVIVMALGTTNGFLPVWLITTSSMLLGISTVLAVVTTYGISNYTCRGCGEVFHPSFWSWLIAPQIMLARWIRCPKCSKKTWCRNDVFTQDCEGKCVRGDKDRKCMDKRNKTSKAEETPETVQSLAEEPKTEESVKKTGNKKAK